MLEKLADIDSRIKQIASNAICDGIVDLDSYHAAPKKILWVLKEVNSEDDDGDWDLREAIRELKTEHGIKKGWDKTFSSIVYVTYGILHSKKWDEIPYTYDDPSVVDVLKSIAYINVKKFPGGARANPDEIRQAYLDNKELLWDQINLINPEIIIFGGTFYLFENDIDANNKAPFNSCNLIKSSDKRFIDAYHPQYIGLTREKYFKDIISALQN